MTYEINGSIIFVCWIEVTKIINLFANVRPSLKIGGRSLIHISKVILVPARHKLFNRAFYCIKI